MGVKISVITTVYNAAPFLAEAIESILGQTFTDFEFLLIDDGSSDGSAGILRDYSKRDKRIRVMTLAHNRGTPYASNVGLKKAQAPLIARMDADDISLPERLQQQYDYMKQHSEVGLLGSSYIAFREGAGNRESLHHVLCPERLSQERYASASIPVVHGTSLYRRNLALALGGYREFFRYGAEDLDLFLRLQERTSLANLPEPLLLCRLAPASMFRRHRLRTQNSALVARFCAFQRRAGLSDPLEAALALVPSRLGLPKEVTLEQLRSTSPRAHWIADRMAEWLVETGAGNVRLYLELANTYRRSPRRLLKSLQFLARAFSLDTASAMRLIFPTSRRLPNGARSTLPVRAFG